MNENTCAGEDLYTMVVFIHNNNSVIMVGGNPSRKIKLAVSSTLDSKFELECSIGKKNLNSVVATIGYNDFIAFVNTNAPGPRNISIFMSIKAKC